MTLSQKIAVALHDRSSESTVVEAAEDACKVVLRLREASGVGVALEALEFSTTRRDAWSPDALRAWGDRIASRLTYLMEPLVVLELDPIGGEAEIRSQTPTRRGEQYSYYQIRLHKDGGLRLVRTLFNAEERTKTPGLCRFTNEVLERLVDDLEGSVAV